MPLLNRHISETHNIGWMLTAHEDYGGGDSQSPNDYQDLQDPNYRFRVGHECGLGFGFGVMLYHGDLDGEGVG